MFSRASMVLLLVSLLIAAQPDVAAAQGTCALLAAQGGNPGVGGNTPDTDLFLINPLNGNTNAVVGSTGVALTGLARDPITGALFGVTAGATPIRNLVRVDPASAATTVVGPLPMPNADIAFRADGALFGWSEQTDDLTSINTTTGQATVVGNSAIGTAGSGLAFAPDGTLFFAPRNLGNYNLRTVDPTTGLTTLVALLTGTPLPAGELISALTFSPSGTLFGINLRNNLPRDSFLVSIATDDGGVTTRGQLTAPRMDALEWVCLPAFDFDGDLRADLGVFRPSTSQWLVFGSTTGFTGAVPFGAPGDVALPADYDGDRKSDFAVYRPSTAQWLVFGSQTGFTGAVTLGSPGLGDKPVPADYDGDGKTDLAVYRPSTSQWFVFGSTTGFPGPVTLGTAGDIAVPADYDGDGKADLAVFRPSTAQWLVFGSVTGFGGPVTLGAVGDIPVPADYDGDGKADLAVYRPSTAQWFIFGSLTGFSGPVTLGSPGLGDIPVPADYDGDGKADLAVFRPGTAQWFVFGSLTGFGGPVTLGSPGLDIPLNRPAALR